MMIKPLLSANKIPERGKRGATVKMADIAEIAGVSEGTVSRALSGSPLVNAETRERVRKIAEERGYTIDLGARNLRLRQTGTVAVVIPLLHEPEQRLSDPFFLELLGYLADCLSLKGYDLLLSRIGADRPGDLQQLISSRRADGVLLIGQSTAHAAIERIAKKFGPLVVWGVPLPKCSYVTVGSDNRAGARAAVRHLLMLGRRHIAFFGNKALPEVKQRYLGYCDALNEARIALEPNLEMPVQFAGSSALEATRALIDNSFEFDAIFAASDLIAMEVIKELDQRGLRVPDAIAVVGFDDVIMAAAYTPALTTVHQNLMLGAQLMVAKLLDRIAGRPVDSALLPCELIIRRSCGTPYVQEF